MTRGIVAAINEYLQAAESLERWHLSRAEARPVFGALRIAHRRLLDEIKAFETDLASGQYSAPPGHNPATDRAGGILGQGSEAGHEAGRHPGAIAVETSPRRITFADATHGIAPGSPARAMPVLLDRGAG